MAEIVKRITDVKKMGEGHFSGSLWEQDEPDIKMERYHKNSNIFMNSVC